MVGITHDCLQTFGGIVCLWHTGSVIEAEAQTCCGIADCLRDRR